MAKKSKFTPELAAAICRRVSGGETLRDVCASKDMPVSSAVHRWLANNSEFRAQYVVARNAMIEALVDKALHYAETATEKNAHARRLYVDTVKWYASKIAPKIYGDKVDVNVSGTVSVGDAIEEGRRRVARLRDGGNVVDLRPVLALPAPSEEPLDNLPEVS